MVNGNAVDHQPEEDKQNIIWAVYSFILIYGLYVFFGSLKKLICEILVFSSNNYLIYFFFLKYKIL